MFMTLRLDGVGGGTGRGVAVTGREELVWCEVEGRIPPVYSHRVCVMKLSCLAVYF